MQVSSTRYSSLISSNDLKSFSLLYRQKLINEVHFYSFVDLKKTVKDNNNKAFCEIETTIKDYVFSITMKIIYKKSAEEE